MISINSWSDQFENADSRKRQRLGRFDSPTGCDSRGYRLLMRHGLAGAAALGVFQGLCQVMATFPKDVRETADFVNSDGSEMDIDDLAEITRIDASVMSEALALLEKVGWLNIKRDAVTGNLPPICHPSATRVPPACQEIPALCKSKTKAKPRTKPMDKARPKVAFSSEFELFWEQVPHKIAKGNAWRAWQSAIKSGAEWVDIAAGLPGYRSSEQKRKGQDNGDFRPLHPATWLNGRRWEDEVEIIPDFSRRTEADFTDEDPPPF